MLSICSTLARAHRGTTGLSDIAANTLAHRLAAHFTPNKRPSGRLERSTVDRIAEFVDAELSAPLAADRRGVDHTEGDPSLPQIPAQRASDR